jgi:hypothetical protein
MRAASGVAALALFLVAAPALAEDVKSECIDASEKAQKLVDQRRLLEARNGFLSCAKDACPEAVRRDCQTQYDAVKKNIPSMIVRVTGKDGSDVAQGAVSLDGVQIGVLDGKELEANPGTHEIAVALPDGSTFHRQVILAPGEHARVVAFDARQPVAAAPVATPEKPQTHWSVVRSFGLVSMIAGGVGLVAGGIFLAFDLLNQSTAGVSDPAQCPDQSPTSTCIRALDAARTDQTIFEAASITGGVLLIGGIVMFVVGGNVTKAPEKPAAKVRFTPWFGPEGAGLGLAGTF